MKKQRGKFVPRGENKKRKGYRYQLAVQRYTEIRNNQYFRLLQEYRNLIDNPRS